MSDEPKPPVSHQPFVGRLLIWLSGAHESILDQIPTDRAKYQGIGGAVLTTATLACVSMYVALRMATRAPQWGALVISIIWFFFILNLDRWLVASTQRTQNRTQSLIIGIPRLALALLFGFIISTPLVLQIFSPEITAQINVIHLQESTNFQSEQTSGEVGKRIRDLESQESSLLRTISASGNAPNPEADPEIIDLRAQLETWMAKRDKAREKAACELWGRCAGSTGRAGSGILYQQYRAEEREAQKEIDDFNKRLESRLKEIAASAATSRKETLSQAKAALPSVQALMKRLLEIQAQEQARFTRSNEKNRGLLIQLKALDQVSSRDTTLALWRTLLFLLITSIETLPMLVKFLQIFGPPSAYDRILEVEEEQNGILAADAARKRRAAAMEQSSEEWEFAQNFHDERRKLIRTLAAKAVQENRERITADFTRWLDEQGATPEPG